MHSQFMTQLAREAKQLIGENDDLAKSYLDVLCGQIEKFNSSEEVVAPAPAKYSKLESPEGLDLSLLSESKPKKFNCIKINKRYLDNDLIIEVPDKEDPEWGAIAHSHWLDLNEDLGWIVKIDDGFRRAVGYRYAQYVKQELGEEPIRDKNNKTYIPRSHAMIWQRALLNTYLAAPNGKMKISPIFFEKQEPKLALHDVY